MTVRFAQISALAEQLAAWVNDLRDRSARLKPGSGKDALLEGIERTDTAARWANSSDLKPPE